MTDRRRQPRGQDRRHNEAERQARDCWRATHAPGAPAHFTVGELMRCPGLLAPRLGTRDRPIACGQSHGHAEQPTTIRVLVRPYPILEAGATHRVRCWQCGSTLRFYATRESAA